MPDRREFLIRSSLAAAGAIISPRLFAEDATEHWPPSNHGFVIDGQGASSVFYLQDDDPALAAESQAIRDSGLTGF